MTDGEGHDEGSLLALAMLALVAGAVAGIVGAIFRLGLEQADRLRNLLIGWAHGQGAGGFLVVVAACASATAVAGWLVRRYLAASGRQRHPSCRGRSARRASSGQLSA